MTVSILEHLNKNLRDNLQPKSFCGSWYAFRCNNVSCSIFQERRRRSERQWKLLCDFAQREWTYEWREMKPNERVSEAGRESEDGREDAGPSSPLFSRTIAHCSPCVKYPIHAQVYLPPLYWDTKQFCATWIYGSGGLSYLEFSIKRRWLEWRSLNPS